jgi:putative ABC transport system permease protein
LRVDGIVHDGALAPGWQDQLGYAYASAETIATLGPTRESDELRILAQGDRAAVAQLAEASAGLLTRRGVQIERIELPAGEHPHADHMSTVLLLLLVFASLAILLSGTLSANLITGILGRQSRQIGVLKTMGGTSRALVRLYLTLVASLVIPPVCAGVPLGLWGARAFARFGAGQMNLQLASEHVPALVIGIVASVAMFVPLLATLVPVRRASRAPVIVNLRGADAAPDRAGGSRPPAERVVVRLAFRNALRKPGRVALTLAALAAGGAALMTALNVHASLTRAVDAAFDRRKDDIEVRLLQPLDADTLKRRIEKIPGVDMIEIWGALRVSLRRQEGADIGTERYAALAAPVGSTLFAPRLHAGRWISAGHPDEIVVNRARLAREPSLVVGARTELKFLGRRAEVRIVGIAEEMAEPHVYAGQSTLDALTETAGLGGSIRAY